MNRFNSNFIQSKVSSQQKKEGTTYTPARVRDVILDSKHPEYEKYGGPSSIGVVKYELLTKSTSQKDTKLLPPAFPINSTVRVLPLKNEVVLLQSAPDTTSVNDKLTNKATYYSTVVGIWNQPNHNAFPKVEEEPLDLGDNIPELSNINPLLPHPGDMMVEGRQGQSIRLTGYQGASLPFIDERNNGKPVTIISNGQKNIGNGFEHIGEDINKDDSSIYLVSDHTIPLDPARTKREAFTEKPVTSDTYRGSQVMINGGRLYFNAKEEDIQLNSKNNLGITSNIVGIDAADYIGLDGKKIYLGSNARKFELQPNILGDALEGWLYTLTLELERIGDALSGALTVDGKAIPKLNVEGPILKAVTKGLQKQINPGGESLLKSKKVFTE